MLSSRIMIWIFIRVTLLYGHLAVTTTCHNNIIVLNNSYCDCECEQCRIFKTRNKLSFADILSTCQLRISLTRTAQIYLELHFCAELHIKSPDSPFTVKTIDRMHQTGPRILLSVTHMLGLCVN